MDLHDLSEELPVNWERIPEMAQKPSKPTKLMVAKQKLAALGA